MYIRETQIEVDTATLEAECTLAVMRAAGDQGSSDLVRDLRITTVVHHPEMGTSTVTLTHVDLADRATVCVDYGDGIVLRAVPCDRHGPQSRTA